MIKVYFSALLLILLTGCKTLSLNQSTMLLNEGDSKVNVLEIMGAPYDRQFKSNVEAWQYCLSNGGLSENDHKVIWLSEDRVIGITSYRSRGVTCTGKKDINWEEAPRSNNINTDESLKPASLARSATYLVGCSQAAPGKFVHIERRAASYSKLVDFYVKNNPQIVSELKRESLLQIKNFNKMSEDERIEFCTHFDSQLEGSKLNNSQ